MFSYKWILIVLTTGPFVASCVHVDPTVDCPDDSVHIHLYGAAKFQAKSYVSLLEKSGMQVCVRDNEPPDTSSKNIIIWASTESGLALRNQLETVLALKGVDIESRYKDKLGTHSYTDGNVGVYLWHR